jgi:hypothetical protein
MKKITTLLPLITIPHIIILAAGYMLCDEMACMIPPVYVMYVGTLYTILILILFFKFANAEAKPDLFFLFVIYVYCGIGPFVIWSGYFLIASIIKLTMGCLPSNYGGYCSAASVLNAFYPPVFLLLLVFFRFFFKKKK